jgi:hypothetical protein
LVRDGVTASGVRQGVDHVHHTQSKLFYTVFEFGLIHGEIGNRKSAFGNFVTLRAAPPMD